MLTRRKFLQSCGTIAFASQFSIAISQASQPLLKPPKLKIGDTVGLISPASPIRKSDLKFIQLQLAQQGLNVKVAPHVLDQYGSLAGVDRDRAADINTFFEDSSVQALIATTGGWGSGRILPLLDYDLISS